MLEIPEPIRRLLIRATVSGRSDLLGVPSVVVAASNRSVSDDFYDFQRRPITRRVAPSSFLPSTTAGPSTFVPAIRCYSAHAGLSKDEVQGRILDLLKNFDKVRNHTQFGSFAASCTD
jgi:hypothetical protein